MYVCAQIRHEPVRHGNIGLSDGGRIKGVAKDGIRDTVVDRANFGKYLREQPTAGMINPDQPTQHGHSPARGASARYDDVGPRFNHKKVRNNITIPAGTPSRGKLKFDWGNKGVGTYTYQQKEGETPGDNVLADLDTPGVEWWRGVRKGKAQLLWETGHANPAHDTIGVEWINDWAKDYKANVEIQSMATHQRQEECDPAPGGPRALPERRRRSWISSSSGTATSFLLRRGITQSLLALALSFAGARPSGASAGRSMKHLALVSLGSQSFKMYGSGEICDAPLPFERVRKFARRARVYRKMFDLYTTPESAVAALKVCNDGGEDGTEYILESTSS